MTLDFEAEKWQQLANELDEYADELKHTVTLLPVKVKVEEIDKALADVEKNLEKVGNAKI